MSSDARTAHVFGGGTPTPTPAHGDRHDARRVTPSAGGPPATPASDDDGGTIDAFLAALQARTRRQHLCEAALAGATLALIVLLALLRYAGTPLLTSSALAAFAAGAVGWAIFRADARREPALIAQAEAAHPALRNLLVTDRELTRVPDRATPRMRARVRQDAARVVSGADPAALIPSASCVRPLAGALLIAAIAVGIVAARQRGLTGSTASDRDAAAAAARDGAASGTSDEGAALDGGIRSVTVIVTPPAYSGRPAVTQTNPTSVTALAGSTIALNVESSAPALLREFGGQRQPLTRAAASNRSFTGSIVAEETGVLLLTATNGDAANPVELARRILAVAVTPDQPPTVKLVAPAKDLLFPDANGSVAFKAEATDDIGLRALTLHYTKVTGSGERYEFTEGEIPFTVARQDARTWQAETTRTLKSLEINEGDTFVYYAAATDHRPGQPRAVSDSFVIEIGQAGIAIAGGFAIPPEEDRFAISLNALIQKTEKLHARRPAMARAAFAEASLGLAIEQRMVRSEFLFSMGSHGHVQDEAEEAEHSDEIQAGRLENRGQAELSEATRQMTRAEQHLTDAETGPALVAQRAALAAVQRAMSRQRYFLRTLAVGGTIDPTRRLTGDLAEARPGARPEGERVDTARAETLRDVLRTLAGLSATLADRRGAATSPPSPPQQPRQQQQQPQQETQQRPQATQAPAPASAVNQPTSPQTAGARPSAEARLAPADTARSLAGRVLAIDPASQALRGASQRLLDAASAIDARDAARAIPLVQQAADALLPLMRDALAPAGTAPAGAAGSAADRQLRGARLDALRRQGGAR